MQLIKIYECSVYENLLISLFNINSFSLFIKLWLIKFDLKKMEERKFC